MDRRDFVRGTAGVLGAAALGDPMSALARSRRRPTLHVDRFRRSHDGDATLSIRRALAAAHEMGGARVMAAPGRVYRVSPHGTFDALNPSGGTARYPVCIQVPPGVTLDMRGSTLQLRGSAEATLVANTNLTGTGVRDMHVGLVNAVLDGRHIPFTGSSLLHLGHLDRLLLRRVKIIRGVYQGGWVYDCTRSVFDDLDANWFVGQPWTIGSPLGANQVYDSRFGRLRASNVARINDTFQPGNSFDLVLTRCRIHSIKATRCAAGIKVQWPGADIRIGHVETEWCGDRSGNSGLKLQGDEVSGPVSRVEVGRVVARNQAGIGLFLEYCRDCSVHSYSGFGNNRNGTAADVWIGGVNDYVGSLSSEGSGGIGVIVRPYATGYRVRNARIRNPGRVAAAVDKVGVAVFGGSGVFERVSCIDSRRVAAMSRGVDVNAPSAVGRIGRLTVSGQRKEAFASVAPTFPPPASSG